MGRECIPASGSELFAAFSRLAEAELLLVLEDDAKGALEVLGRSRQPGRRPDRFIREQASTLQGLALLICREDEAAVTVLEEAVESMRAGDRVLHLPAAAVYLAEAHWRTSQ